MELNSYWLRIIGNSTYYSIFKPPLPTASHRFYYGRCYKTKITLYLWCGTSIDDDVTPSTLRDIKKEQILLV
jgi:hypothetical protein